MILADFEEHSSEDGVSLYQARRGDALVCLEFNEQTGDGELSLYERGEELGVCGITVMDDRVESRNVDVFPVIAGTLN